MRTLFGLALLLIGVVTLAVETQVKQQDIKGDCNVALGVNQGKVEVKCGLHEAALKPLADKLSTLQKEQKLRDKEMDALVQSVNLLMSAVLGAQDKIIGEIRQGNRDQTEEITKRIDETIKQQVARVIDRVPAQGGEALERFKQEAETWHKQYDELLAKWNTVQGDERANQALEGLRAGDLDRAARILDEILPAQDQVAEKAAPNHFRRGQIYELQFKPREALEQYDAAYRYAPKNLEYSHAYASLLQRQNQFKKAARVYEDNLEALRELAEKDPDAYEPGLATTLNNLGRLYAETQRFAEAEKAYLGSLNLLRKLAQKI